MPAAQRLRAVGCDCYRPPAAPHHPRAIARTRRGAARRCATSTGGSSPCSLNHVATVRRRSCSVHGVRVASSRPGFGPLGPASSFANRSRIRLSRRSFDRDHPEYPSSGCLPKTAARALAASPAAARGGSWATANAASGTSCGKPFFVRLLGITSMSPSSSLQPTRPTSSRRNPVSINSRTMRSWSLPSLVHSQISANSASESTRSRVASSRLRVAATGLPGWSPSETASPTSQRGTTAPVCRYRSTTVLDLRQQLRHVGA
jgi:hypothetical protein